jgi:hypothetical protein
MEEEIESNNFEGAALLQAQIEWIHERCSEPNLCCDHPVFAYTRCLYTNGLI